MPARQMTVGQRRLALPIFALKQPAGGREPVIAPLSHSSVELFLIPSSPDRTQMQCSNNFTTSVVEVVLRPMVSRGALTIEEALCVAGVENSFNFSCYPMDHPHPTLVDLWRRHTGRKSAGSGPKLLIGWSVCRGFHKLGSSRRGARNAYAF